MHSIANIVINNHKVVVNIIIVMVLNLEIKDYLFEMKDIYIRNYFLVISVSPIKVIILNTVKEIRYMVIFVLVEVVTINIEVIVTVGKVVLVMVD